MRADLALSSDVARIGVMGGMFDPVHSGHLQAALTAVRLLALDQLRLVPCHVPNHRGPAKASPAERLEMLQLATADEPRLLVDPREMERDGVSYTVDTLASLRSDFPEATLVLVLGWDAFSGLPSWHRWRDLLTLAHMLVISRPSATSEQPLIDGLAQTLRRCQVASTEELFSQPAGAILVTDELQVDISSTQVRNLLHDGSDADTLRRSSLLPSSLPPSSLLPRAVAQYIDQHGLYR